MARLERRSGDLAGLDALSVDAIVAPLFEGATQPQGVAGYVDWRLSGRLARLILSGRFRGSVGESLLMGSLDRVGAARIFLFGLGPADKWLKAPHADDVPGILRRASEAGVGTLALAPPVGANGSPSALEVMKVWRPACAKAEGAPISVLDADGSLAQLFGAER